MLGIYADIAFFTIVVKERLTSVYAVAAVSLVIMAVPKVYAVIVTMVLICGVKEEDKRRKYAYRVLVFNEQRLQALNIQYIRYSKAKTGVLIGLLKFFA